MNQQALYRNWNRSYQEDTDTRMVFRPDDFTFPPPTDRFGRASITLDADNRFSQKGNIFRKEANLSANDSFSNVDGRWNVGENIITLYPDAGSDEFILKIISMDEEQFVIERHDDFAGN